MRKKASCWKVRGGGEDAPGKGGPQNGYCQLWAGGDKGETGLRLPLRLFFGFVKFCFCCLAGLWLLFVTGVVLCCVVLCRGCCFCCVLCCVVAAVVVLLLLLLCCCGCCSVLLLVLLLLLLLWLSSLLFLLLLFV